MRFEYARDQLKEWRWVLKATNGSIVAVSPKPYRDRSTCVAAIEVVKRAHEAAMFEVAAF